MTVEQAGILALMVVLLVVFAFDRFRIELVALTGLAFGTALGLVPADTAFAGFSSPAVVTVAEILVLVQSLIRSHLVDWLSGFVAKRVRTEAGVLAAVCSAGAFLSVFMNNIGALALMLPFALSLCRSADVRPGVVLMPLSFATLLGGTCSLIGTPANLVVSQFRQEALGVPLPFFPPAEGGLAAAVVGVVLLCLASPRLLGESGLGTAGNEIAGPRRFVAEFRIGAGSPLAGLPVPELERRLGGRIYTHLRHDRYVFGRREAQVVEAGDLVLAETDVGTASDILRLGEAAVPLQSATGAERWIEAVVLPQSVIVGSALGNIAALEGGNVEVVAVSPQTHRIEGRLADLRVSVGDVFLLRGNAEALRQALADMDCLALSPRGVVAPEPESWAALAAFVLAIVLSALGVLGPQIAFGLAVLALALAGTLDLPSAVAELNWPILIMLASMIPLGAAVESTGAADIVARHLLQVTGSNGQFGLSVVILVATLAITPFVNNVSTAAALAPIAYASARSSGIPADPLLLLVAVGASLDFVTPFGHHNNTLILGIGGYRFSDFLRLGIPLTLASAAMALLASTII